MTRIGNSTRTSSVSLCFFLLALPCIAFAEPGDRRSTPAELRQFVAKDEAVLAAESADLNGDGLRDVVFIVEPLALNYNDDQADEDTGRTLKIAIRSADGSLKVVKESSNAVYCRSCGGAFGDPFAGLSASNKTFSVHHYGGSSLRWSDMFTFNYSKRDRTWQLVAVVETSFHASEPEKQTIKTYRPPRHFGKIDLAEFDPQNFKGAGAK